MAFTEYSFPETHWPQTGSFPNTVISRAFNHVLWEVQFSNIGNRNNSMFMLLQVWRYWCRHQRLQANVGGTSKLHRAVESAENSLEEFVL